LNFATKTRLCLEDGAIDVVIFDLDGTLLDSEKLVANDRRRTPFDVLRFTAESEFTTPLTRWKEVKEHLSLLIQCGVKVAVITESPRAYASTACYLLGVDFHILLPNHSSSNFNSKRRKIDFLIRGLRPESSFKTRSELLEARSRVLYMGNTVEDEITAQDFGIQYQDVEEFLGSNTSKFGKLVEHVSAAAKNEVGLNSDAECRHSQYASIRKQMQLNSLSLLAQYETRIGILDNFAEVAKDIAGNSDVFNIVDANAPFLKPILHPFFITRYEYDNDSELRSKLFDVLEIHFGADKIDLAQVNQGLASISGYAHQRYRDSPLGQKLWLEIKNWKGSASGREVSLLHLEFISVCLSASISKSLSAQIICPVPSSAFSRDKPGRVSNRLAKRVSHLTQLPYFEAIKRDDGKELYLNSEGLPFQSKIVLIDDQLTTGSSLLRSIHVLLQAGSELEEARVWSSSQLAALENSSLSAEDSEIHSDSSNSDFPLSPFLSSMAGVAQYSVGQEEQFIVTDFIFERERDWNNQFQTLQDEISNLHFQIENLESELKSKEFALSDMSDKVSFLTEKCWRLIEEQEANRLA
jgi:phosphoglycolate phosphatase-like HAD superfamily hydrolase